MTNCQRGFEEELLTGYIDGELSQGQRQRIDVHLAGCEACSALFAGLREVREAARNTSFEVPTDEQWRESARTLPSRWARQIGWLVVLLIATGTAAIVSYEVAASPEPWWIKAGVFGALSGVGLLFVSVLMDRLHDLKNDRYRRVQK